jgi:arylsulfatase A-like enzyme
MPQTLQIALLTLMLGMNLAVCRVSDASSEVDSSSVESNPPNIVLIVADDLGYGDLGSYGQRHIRTPHLDQMAREGMRFTQFYSGSTVCAPSRSVLMTGLHTGHTPIRGNESTYNDQGIITGQMPLPTEAETIAEILKRAGYRTGAFGKWGLGGLGSEGMPTRQGFDTFFGYLGQGRAHFYYPEYLFSNGERVTLEGNETTGQPKLSGAGYPVKRSVFSHDRIVEEALQFIEDSQRQPFFAYLPVTIPHASVTVPEDALSQYTDAGGNSIFAEPENPESGNYSAQPMPKAAYAAMVSRLDRDVGRLMGRLKDLGLAKNTLILFTSDNGPHSEGGYDPTYFNSNGPLRGYKRDLYEGGIRVPLLVWWPGTVEAGATSDLISYFGDFMATFADLAGTESTKPNDSITMVPTLLGRSGQSRHDYLYWEFYEQGSKQAVRKGQWKAVRTPMIEGEIELYNLRSDLDESSNVADEHPELIEKFDRIMERAHKPSSTWKVSQ